MENISLSVTFDWVPMFGFVLVFLNSLLPVFRDWYAELDPDQKQYANSGMLLALELGAVGLGYLGMADVYNIGDYKVLIQQVVVDYVTGIVVLNSTYSGTKYVLDKVQKKFVKEEKPVG